LVSAQAASNTTAPKPSKRPVLQPFMHSSTNTRTPAQAGCTVIRAMRAPHSRDKASPLPTRPRTTLNQPPSIGAPGMLAGDRNSHLNLAQMRRHRPSFARDSKDLE
jgi:hypothetical protein